MVGKVSLGVESQLRIHYFSSPPKESLKIKEIEILTYSMR